MNYRKIARQVVKEQRDKKKKEEMEKGIIVARFAFRRQPFATRLYVSMKTGIALSFIKKHWDKIIDNGPEL